MLCALYGVFPSKTGSLSLILGSFYFNYLLDDLVHLAIDLAPTQTSSIPRGENSMSGYLLWPVVQG